MPHVTVTGIPSSGHVPSGPRLALSTACLSGSLDDKLYAASAAGFSTIELLTNDLLLSASSPRQARAEAARLGMSIEVVQPLHVEALPDSMFRALLRRADRALDIVNELGAQLLLLCSTRSVDGLDDDDVAVQQLRELADRSAQRGVRLAYEAVPWGRVATHDAAWGLVEGADHDNLGLCLDSFHVLSRATIQQPSRVVPCDKVFHVQLADSPRLNMDDRDWSRHHRAFPGWVVRPGRLRQRTCSTTGYSGPLAIEVFNDVYQQADPRYAATGAMRAMHTFEEAVGWRERWTGIDSSTVACRRRPRLGGYVFTELAVDDVSEPVLTPCPGRTRVSPILASIGPSQCSYGSRAPPVSC